MRIISPRSDNVGTWSHWLFDTLCLVLSSVFLILKTELEDIATWAVLEPRLDLSNQSYDL